MWGLSSSAIIPTYIRVNRPDIISDIVKKKYKYILSNKLCDILFTEIDNLHRKAISLFTFDKDIFETAKSYNMRISNAVEKFNKIKDIKDQEYEGLSKKDAYRLREKLDAIFGILKNLQQLELKNKEIYNVECDKNYNALNNIVNNCIYQSKTTTDWYNTKQYLIFTQNQIKEYKLKKEQKQELFNNLQTTFNILHERQQKSIQEYNNMCDNNYRNILGKLRNIQNKYISKDNINDIKNDLKYIHSELKDIKMKKEQKHELFNLAQELFENINKEYQNIKIQKQQEWECAQLEKLNKLYSIVTSIEDSIYNLKEFLSELRYKYNNISPGKRQYEIQKSIENKINNVENQIEDKKEKLYNLKIKIKEIENSL